jgi:hypothetical protein
MDRDPERDRWPLCPRVDVLPMPLPMPRPTRLRLAVAPFGGLNVDKFVGTLSFPLRSRSVVVGSSYSVSLSPFGKLGN